ncbi:hypothetical protein NDU88_000803 [Pleurodeles waltl]|uniref:Uncharacterized protein n=1 Tax=Pleurodeles waltl TaxID=8319 RepID=A0AAV7S8V4_PLEWA|nr:hypothetical protein NDU88_000803 [Pleurodeles waltl]
MCGASREPWASRSRSVPLALLFKTLPGSRTPEEQRPRRDVSPQSAASSSAAKNHSSASPVEELSREGEGEGREQRSIKGCGLVKETLSAPCRNPLLTHRSPQVSRRGTPARAPAVNRVRPSSLSVTRGPARDPTRRPRASSEPPSTIQLLKRASSRRHRDHKARRGNFCHSAATPEAPIRILGGMQEGTEGLKSDYTGMLGP